LNVPELGPVQRDDVGHDPIDRRRQRLGCEQPVGHLLDHAELPKNTEPTTPSNALAYGRFRGRSGFF